MTKLRVAEIEDGKPIRLTLELPPAVDRNLAAYAQAIAHQTGQAAPDKGRLAVEMLTRFMATDRAFARLRRNNPGSDKTS